jgi:tRNA-splicing ligase RtcB
MPIEITIDDTRVPVKIWTDQVEPEAREQLRNIANLPFVTPHVAAMPDVHLGKGATVGSVVPTRGAICPATVGVDIGCGMVAQKTNLTIDDLDAETLKRLRREIERAVPVGFQERRKPLPEAREFLDRAGSPRVAKPGQLQKAALQLGTLGGGNHFIEVCVDHSDRSVWVVLHSGSRNIGKSVAEVHINKAKGLMRRRFIDLPDADLAYFTEGTEDFEDYLSDVEWCQQYARRNRELMMDAVLRQLADLTRGQIDFDEILGNTRVDCHHNYIAREHHFGQAVLLTRKGAISARKGEMGIIPGSMGTGTFMVRGLGNREAFESAPHGAGRRMSRGQARRQFTIEDLRRQTEGVECRKDAGIVDEIPAAYKDIHQVIEKSADLVEVVTQVKQVVCAKG